MSSLKKYFIHLLFCFISIFILLFFITILYYFSILKEQTFNSIKLIGLIISIFLTSYSLGNKTNNKGYLEGLKLSSIIIFLFIIISLFFSSFKVKLLIYYLIILVTSLLGSMIGISRKKEK